MVSSFTPVPIFFVILFLRTSEQPVTAKLDIPLLFLGGDNIYEVFGVVKWLPDKIILLGGINWYFVSLLLAASPKLNSTSSPPPLF